MSATAEHIDGKRVGGALAYAARLHAGQTRTGKDEPYLSHVLLVSALVMRYGGDEDQIVAGALHDVPRTEADRPAWTRSDGGSVQW